MQDAAARIQGELIANETELRGLQQIYSDDNVRVRTLKARIGELQSQMHRIVGGTGTSEGESVESNSSPPSLRALPILGYQYSDLYRRAKIQETLYELLTQQYEMAKVQEAKELPTARVMDVAVPPEKKSGPIRTLIMGLSVLGGLVLAGFWVISKNSWDQLPADDSRRMLAGQVRYDLRALFGRAKSRGQTAVPK
jgi:capsule polysaccharide export protein KpsE/RkpR